MTQAKLMQIIQSIRHGIMWCDNKIRELIAVKVLHISLLNTTYLFIYLFIHLFIYFHSVDPYKVK